MLPFDSLFYTAFIVLTLTVTLYFTLLIKLKPSTGPKLSRYVEKPPLEKSHKKNPKASKPMKSTEPRKENESEEKECPHYVGYLTSLPKGSPFPDECFGCRKVIKCLKLEPTGVIESFYLTPEAK